MRSFAALVAFVIGFAPAQAAGPTNLQASTSQQRTQQVTVLLVEGMT